MSSSRCASAGIATSPGRGSEHGERKRCWDLSLRNRLRRCGLPTHHRDFRRFRLLLRPRRPRAGIEERQSEQDERGNQRAPSEYAAVSSAIASIHGVVAPIVVSFSHVRTDWSISVTPVCSVMKWPMAQVKFLPMSIHLYVQLSWQRSESAC